MKQFSKYDPEDIESLLIHKQFNELYPEEKEFVLRHIDGVEEYESMRRMLLELRSSEGTDEWLTPDASIKKQLMAEFARERKGRFNIWLNSLFAMPERPWYGQRGVQWSFGVAIVAGAFFFLQPKNNEVILAENNATELQDSTAQSSDQANSNTTLSQTKKTVVDTTQSNAIPAAPKVLAMVAPAPVAADNANSSIKEEDYAAPMNDNVVMNDGAEVQDEELSEAKDMKVLPQINDATLYNSSSIKTTTLTTTTTYTNSSANHITEGTAYTFVVQNNTSMSNYSDLLDLMFTAK